MTDALRSLRAFVVVGLALFSGLFLGLVTVVSASAKGRESYAGLEVLARALSTVEESYVDEPDSAESRAATRSRGSSPGSIRIRSGSTRKSTRR